MDAAGWYLAYYLGMWEYILEAFGKDAFQNVVFEGISAGGHASAYVVASVHGSQSLRHWLEYGPKWVVRQNMHSDGQFTKGQYDAGYAFHTSLNKSQRRANRKYVRAYCLTDTMELYCCEKIRTSEEHAQAASATGNVPIVSSCSPMTFRGTPLWDGALYRDYEGVVNTNRMLYITFSPRFVCKHILNLSDWVYISAFISLLPCFLPQTLSLVICDQLFDRGYSDAKSNRDELQAAFRSIGISI